MISLVITYCETDPEKKEILKRCIDSFKGQYDELIIAEDKIHNLSRNVNKGMLLAKGDFIVVCADDITLNRGTLKETCIEDVVTTPYVNDRFEKLFPGHMYTIPRRILSEVGLWDETYDGFLFSDSDYWMQIEHRGFEIRKLKEVNILHPHPARTTDRLFKEGREEFNRKKFISKWGIDGYKRIYPMT